eukprot:384814-Prorocentrum_minimum.AAC.1
MLSPSYLRELSEDPAHWAICLGRPRSRRMLASLEFDLGLRDLAEEAGVRCSQRHPTTASYGELHLRLATRSLSSLRGPLAVVAVASNPSKVPLGTPAHLTPCSLWDGSRRFESEASGQAQPTEKGQRLCDAP